MRDPDFTLSAGPVTASARVLAALGSPITYHYDPVFLEAFRRTERKLAEIFLTENDVLLMQGEAVLGLEAGARFSRPARNAGAESRSGRLRQGDGLLAQGLRGRAARARGAVQRRGRPSGRRTVCSSSTRASSSVTVVHSETPSGTLCDVAAIGPIARAHGALTLVDCVSSARRDPAADGRVAARRLRGGAAEVPGGTAGDVADDRERGRLERIRSNPSAPRASFLSMLDWKEQWIDGEKFPFTPSVVRRTRRRGCLRRAARGGTGGVDRAARGIRFGVPRRRARDGARALAANGRPRRGLCDGDRVPDGLTDVQVRAHCRQRYGVMISAGQGAGNLVRIGHMGPSARSLHPVVGLAAIGQTLRDLGAPVDIGSPGVEAAASPSSHRRVRPSSSHDLRLAHARRLVRVDVRRLARPRRPGERSCKSTESGQGSSFHPDNAYVREVVESIPGYVRARLGEPPPAGLPGEAERNWLAHPKFLGMKLHPLLDGYHPNTVQSPLSPLSPRNAIRSAGARASGTLIELPPPPDTLVPSLLHLAPPRLPIHCGHPILTSLLRCAQQPSETRAGQ